MNLDEIKIKTEVRKINKGYLYAAFTDKICILKWPLSIQDEEMLEQSFQKMLECRIFNEQMEYRIIRSTIKRYGTILYRKTIFRY